MALIIYPTADADSFISVADATTVIETLTLDGAAWGALSVSEQEVYLRIAYRNIVDHTDTTTYPDPLDICVGSSQALMASWDLKNGLSLDVEDYRGALKKNKVGTIEQEFYDVDKVRSVGTVPTMAKACLEELGYIFPVNANGLTQTILGRS